MNSTKIKKGNLLKANTRMWGHYFLQSHGNVNIRILKDTLLVALTDEMSIGGLVQVETILDNKIVSITISEESQFGVIK